MRKSTVVGALCWIFVLVAVASPAFARPTPNRWAYSDVPGPDPFGFSVFNFGVSFVDDTHGWMCGDDGSMQVTSDGGVTWTAQETGVTANISDVSFADVLRGWAISGSVLLTTSDGGATWGAVDLAASDSRLGGVAIEFVDPSHGWIAGHGGVATTDDGGATWTFREAPVIQYVYNFAFDALDTEYAWYAVGGKVYETRDGGTTWTEIFATDGAHGYMLDDVVVTDYAHGLVVTDGYAWVPTSSDPWAWEFHQFSEENSQWSIAAADSQRAWVAGSHGALAATDDGGLTWFVQSADDWSGVSDIEVRGDHGWACGSGLLSTTHTGYGGMRPPVTTSDLPAVTNHSLPVTLAATDDTPGPLTTYFHLDGDEWQQGTSANLEVPSDHSRDGYHTLSMYSVDADGNDEMTKESVVLVDTVAPALSVGPEDPYMLDYWYNAESRVRLWANDPAPGSGGTVELDFDDAGWVDLGRMSTWVTEAPTDHTNDGVHTLDMRAVDAAGNQSAVESHVVCIDTRKPAAKAPYASTVRRGAYATLKFKIVDARPCYPKGAVGFLVTKLNGRVVMRMLPKKWYPKNTLCSYRFKAWPRQGTYYFYVYVSDGAGNVDPTPARNKLYIK